MRGIRQIVAVTWLNILNLPKRVASSLVAIVGVLAVVLVFAAVLSMAKGFERTMVAAGSDDTAIVLRSGATAELNSGFSYEQTQIIANAPGVAKDGDRPLASAELYVGVTQKDQSQHRGRVLVGTQPGVGSQLVGGAPEVGFQLGIVDGHLGTSLVKNF